MFLHRSLLCVLAILAIAACVGNAPGGRLPVERGGAASLSADSAAVLRAAIEQARPAFATQEDALRADVYSVLASRPVEVSPRPPVPRPAAAASGSADAAFVIQISAHSDPSAADAAAGSARQVFPDLPVRIEQTGSLLRVALGSWSAETEARDALHRVRTHYPDAWIRRAVP